MNPHPCGGRHISHPTLHGCPYSTPRVPYPFFCLSQHCPLVIPSLSFYLLLPAAHPLIQVFPMYNTRMHECLRRANDACASVILRAHGWHGRSQKAGVGLYNSLVVQGTETRAQHRAKGGLGLSADKWPQRVRSTGLPGWCRQGGKGVCECGGGSGMGRGEGRGRSQWSTSWAGNLPGWMGHKAGKCMHLSQEPLPGAAAYLPSMHIISWPVLSYLAGWRRGSNRTPSAHPAASSSSVRPAAHISWRPAGTALWLRRS